MRSVNFKVRAHDFTNIESTLMYSVSSKNVVALNTYSENSVYIVKDEVISNSLDSFKQVVHAIQSKIESPIGMVFNSALSTAATCVQGHYDVVCPGSGHSPTSLFILTIAESGERKSSTDSQFINVINDFVSKTNERINLPGAVFKAECDMWNSQLKVFQKMLDKAIAKDDLDQASVVKKKLVEHYSNKPVAATEFRLLFEDSTMSALLENLADNFPNATLNSSEGGILFERASLQFLLRANKLWDGSTVSVDRAVAPSYRVENARLSISAMVQEKIMGSFTKRSSDGARGSGFLARCLVTKPESTQGKRFGHFATVNVDQVSKNKHYVNWFNSRAIELLDKSYKRRNHPRQVIAFSPEAQKIWKEFHCKVENSLSEKGFLADVSDFASKISNNMSRIAAVLHVFCGLEGRISAEVARFAVSLCEVYIMEFKNLFGFRDPIFVAYSNAIKVYEMLEKKQNCHLNGVSRTWLRQYAPYSCRSAVDLDAALQVLLDHNFINIFQNSQGRGRSSWISLNRYADISVLRANCVAPAKDKWGPLLKS